jgi:hypothetical protein
MGKQQNKIKNDSSPPPPAPFYQAQQPAYGRPKVHDASGGEGGRGGGEGRGGGQMGESPGRGDKYVLPTNRVT